MKILRWVPAIDEVMPRGMRAVLADLLRKELNDGRVHSAGLENGHTCPENVQFRCESRFAENDRLQEPMVRESVENGHSVTPAARTQGDAPCDAGFHTMRRSDSAAVCSVVVTYEDTTTRDRAISICDHLVHKLWEDCEFEFSWWRFDYLRDPEIAVAAVAAANGADLIIFSAHAVQELPRAVKAWIETWLVKRENRESALVALIGTAPELMQGVSPTHIYLRDVAHRAKMDFLTHVPDSLTERLDGGVETIRQRAESVTSVLDKILQQASPPSHWGINE